jgi:hypothetical protein
VLTVQLEGGGVRADPVPVQVDGRQAGRAVGQWRTRRERRRRGREGREGRAGREGREGRRGDGEEEGVVGREEGRGLRGLWVAIFHTPSAPSMTVIGIIPF